MLMIFDICAFLWLRPYPRRGQPVASAGGVDQANDPGRFKWLEDADTADTSATTTATAAAPNGPAAAATNNIDTDTTPAAATASNPDAYTADIATTNTDANTTDAAATITALLRCLLSVRISLSLSTHTKGQGFAHSTHSESALAHHIGHSRSLWPIVLLCCACACYSTCEGREP
jgi:hypothetical protein